MELKCQLIKELDNGGAIVSLEMDEETKNWLIGEGFAVVLQEAVKLSKTYISEKDFEAKFDKPKVGKILPKKGRKK